MLKHWYTFVSVGYHGLFLLVIMVIDVGTPARKGHLSCRDTCKLGTPVCAHSSTKFCLAKVANETNFPLANKNFH